MYVSGNGILAGVEFHRGAHPETLLSTVKPGKMTTAAVLSAAQEGDSLARTVLHEARFMLVQVVTWCAALLNPQMVALYAGTGCGACGNGCDRV